MGSVRRTSSQQSLASPFRSMDRGPPADQWTPRGKPVDKPWGSTSPGKTPSSRDRDVVGRSTESPKTPCNWESPATEKLLELKSKRGERRNQTLLPVAVFIFVATIGGTFSLLMVLGASLTINFTSTLLLALTITCIAMAYMIYRQENLPDDVPDMSVSDHVAALLGVSNRDVYAGTKTEPLPDRSLNWLQQSSHTRMVTPPRLRATGLDSVDSLQRYRSPTANTLRTVSTTALGTPPSKKTLFRSAASPVGRFHESRIESRATDSTKAPSLPSSTDLLAVRNVPRNVGRIAQPERQVEALRRWFALRILEPFQKRDASLSLQLTQLSSTPNLDPAVVNALQTERSNLDRYATVPTYPRAMEYCRARLCTLAEDTSISNARWDSGGEWKGRTFELFGLELPTDAELLITALGAFFDERLPPTTSTRAAFSGRYIAFPPSGGLDSIEHWRVKAGAVIYRVRPRPPHFAVIAPGGKVMETVAGRTNLFYAVLQLLQLIKEGYDGYAGQLYLGDRSIGLLQVLDQ